MALLHVAIFIAILAALRWAAIRFVVFIKLAGGRCAQP